LFRRPPTTAIVVGLLVIGLDQLTKRWALASLPNGREVTIIPDWLWFRLTTNSGASLGLLAGNNMVLAGVSLLIVVAVIILLFRGSAGGQIGAAALGAVAGGATSNLVDRIRLGGVVDFIEVHLWPTDFNLADAAIRSGLVLLLLALLVELGRRRQRQSRRLD
jgi:signal peptidase II